MVLDIPGGLFQQNDVRETATADLTSAQSVPVGAIIAWLKSFAGTPTIPTGYVECDGAVLNDPDSVYDGATIPDLNGGEFLRGDATSGGTGGESTHTLITAEMPAHIHQFDRYVLSTGAISALKRFNDCDTPETVNTTSTGGGGAHENRPPFYNVVWIMRVK